MNPESGPHVVGSRELFVGKVISLRVDDVEIAPAKIVEREVVEHRGAVVFAAMDEDERVYLVKQYRHAIGKELLEFPAGGLEVGEDPMRPPSASWPKSWALLPRSGPTSAPFTPRRALPTSFCMPILRAVSARDGRRPTKTNSSRSSVSRWPSCWSSRSACTMQRAWLCCRCCDVI